MAYWVRVDNGVVTGCIDFPPADPAAWLPAIEVRPPIQDGRESYGTHRFDLSKTPVEIVWDVIPIGINDRKDSMAQHALNKFKDGANAVIMASVEPIGGVLDIDELERLKTHFESVSAAIAYANSHDDLDIIVI